MNKKWTRRKFLETGLRSPLAVGTAVAGIGPPAAGAAAFRPRERALLRAAMDEIIPAADGMPAAGRTFFPHPPRLRVRGRARA